MYRKKLFLSRYAGTAITVGQDLTCHTPVDRELALSGRWRKEPQVNPLGVLETRIPCSFSDVDEPRQTDPPGNHAYFPLRLPDISNVLVSIVAVAAAIRLWPSLADAR